MSGAELILDVRDLSVDYGAGPSAVHALDHVDLKLHRGELLGVAGESGCGKSTLAYALTRLLRPPGVITGGEVHYHRKGASPVDVLALNKDELRKFRWEELAIVFQSAMNALNPVLKLTAQMDDVLRVHRPSMTKVARNLRIGEVLRLVGITADRASSYPHELSGGMRQRAMIAIALLVEPEIIVLDEPTTALDVVLQQQILAEILDLQDGLGFSVVFITHDLSLLLELADTVVVMYAGKIVEMAAAGDLYRKPLHPYTYGLLNSFPLLHGPRRELTGIPGNPPDLRRIPSGCPFHPRCAQARPGCTKQVPELAPSPQDDESAEHLVSCLLYSGFAEAPEPLEEEATRAG